MILEPDFICADVVNAGELEVVLANTQWHDMSAYIIWPGGGPLSQRVRQLIDALASEFQISNS